MHTRPRAERFVPVLGLRQNVAQFVLLVAVNALVASHAA